MYKTNKQLLNLLNDDFKFNVIGPQVHSKRGVNKADLHKLNKCQTRTSRCLANFPQGPREHLSK